VPRAIFAADRQHFRAGVESLDIHAGEQKGDKNAAVANRGLEHLALRALERRQVLFDVTEAFPDRLVELVCQRRERAVTILLHQGSS